MKKLETKKSKKRESDIEYFRRLGPWHESGHATLLRHYGWLVNRITCYMIWFDRPALDSFEKAEIYCRQSMAGYLAVARKFKMSRFEAHVATAEGDFAQYRPLLKHWGLDEWRLEREAAKILREKWSEVEALAHRLDREGEIVFRTEAEIRASI